MSLCQLNSHRAVVGGGKSFHRSASQTNSYYSAHKQPPLGRVVCGDGVKKQLTICCTSKRGAKDGSKIVLGCYLDLDGDFNRDDVSVCVAVTHLAKVHTADV